jgi:hypothetical protein
LSARFGHLPTCCAPTRTCWLAPLHSTSHAYTRDGAKAVMPRDFSRTQVGDETDTSPYANPDRVMGISTSTYIRNMNVLIRFLDEVH